MPWDLTIRRADGLPLGSPQQVSRQIATAFPGVQFYREPSGAEKLASLPPAVKMPDVIREQWATAPAGLQGDLDTGDYSLRFYLGDEGAETLETVAVEARGDTRPAMPLMEALTRDSGWTIVDDRGAVVVAGGQTAPHAR